MRQLLQGVWIAALLCFELVASRHEDASYLESGFLLFRLISPRYMNRDEGTAYADAKQGEKDQTFVQSALTRLLRGDARAGAPPPDKHADSQPEAENRAERIRSLMGEGVDDEIGPAIGSYPRPVFEINEID